MFEQYEIAIIGMSGTFPGAADVDGFYRNLRGGVDGVREVPKDRLINSGLDVDKDYQIAGCLDRIDEFDHEFFGLSLKEAEYMDPQQRFALQLACAAIENAGYALKDFRGSRTAVILGNPVNEYYKLFHRFDPTALSGNMPAALAGRVSYALDLHGPAMTIDTACSSSLVAVHEACQKLLAGRADCAVTGGVSLNIFFNRKGDGVSTVGILAPDGRSKTFDAAANGTGGGEGGGILVLKTLKKALEDGDHVHAVIKGSATNQDGGRSNGITAPSPTAQTEAIVEAWEAAKIDPGTVTYVEAHGTGTKLGDPIEIRGLTDAFNKYTGARKFCAVGSVKTNIGHLDSAAGVAGLIKVVLSLKHGELFPSLHFRTPNPFIDFENSAVYVNTQLRDWPHDGGPRRAGVSSFGLSGTNAHAVLEEAPPAANDDGGAGGAGEAQLVTLSAKTPQALRRYCRSLRDYLETTAHPLAAVAYTLNAGRDDYGYRHAWVVRGRQELLRKLDEALAVAAAPEGHRGKQPERAPVFLFSGDAEVDARTTDALARLYPAFRRAAQECESLARGLTAGPEVGRFVAGYSLYRLCQSKGVVTNRVVGSGVGNIITAVLTEKIELAEGLRRAAALEAGVADIDPGRLGAAVSGFFKDGPPVFVEVGRGGNLSRGIESLGGELGRPNVIALLNGAGEPDVLPSLAELYVNNVSIDWKKFYEGQKPRRVEAPTYPFEKTRCWVSDPLKTPAGISPPGGNGRKAEPPFEAPAFAGPRADGAQAATPEAAGRDVRRELLTIWGEVLKVEDLGVGDDYFDLGGNSLIGTQIITRIEKRLGVSLDFEVFYDYPTVEQLAAYIDGLRQESAPPPPPAADAGVRGEVLELLSHLDSKEAAALLNELMEGSEL